MKIDNNKIVITDPKAFSVSFTLKATTRGKNTASRKFSFKITDVLDCSI